MRKLVPREDVRRSLAPLSFPVGIRVHRPLLAPNGRAAAVVAAPQHIPWFTEPLHLLGGCGVLRPVPADRLQTWSATSEVKCAMSDGVNPELLE